MTKVSRALEPVTVEANRASFGRYVEPDLNSGCHLWSGGRARYGAFNVRLAPNKHVTCSAHRFGWVLENGVQPPPGLVLMHRCDTPLCVNPQHLTLGTQGANMRDCAVKGRANKPNGERSPGAKLTERDVQEIRSAHATKALTRKAMCHRFGISRAHLQRLIRRQNWDHV